MFFTRVCVSELITVSGFGNRVIKEVKCCATLLCPSLKNV